ncbi:MAG: DUF6188 family protein [Alphaproteobacteria bacterium]
MAEPRTLPIDGLSVTRIAIDDSLTLFCRAGDGREGDIRIDGAFSFTDPAGGVHAGCVEDSPASAGPVLGLVMGIIRTARISEEGALEIGFGDGSELSASAEDQFVSWEIKSSDGFHAVCLADRDVVVRDIA